MLPRCSMRSVVVVVITLMVVLESGARPMVLDKYHSQASSLISRPAKREEPSFGGHYGRVISSMLDRARDRHVAGLQQSVDTMRHPMTMLVKRSKINRRDSDGKLNELLGILHILNDVESGSYDDQMDASMDNSMEQEMLRLLQQLGKEKH